MLKWILLFVTTCYHSLYSFVWSPVLLCAFMAVGLYFTLHTRFFQLRYTKQWIKQPFSSLFHKSEEQSPNSITPFQSLCTALAATVGTGNIAGTATALAFGGPGAVFWMCISSFIGMMTIYAENVLGMRYRYKNQNGEWVGGAFITMERGLHAPRLAKLYALLCIFVSLSMGNMVQIHSISSTFEHTFTLPPLWCGITIAFLIGIVSAGGTKRVGQVSERLIPFMAIAYILFSLSVIFMHYDKIPAIFALILSEAFQLPAVSGGILGYEIHKALTTGVSRGVFSNEAGLGTSVLAHTSSDYKEAAEIGMWGIFEVFVDTILVCTLTAFVILSANIYDVNTYAEAVNAGQESRLLNGVPLVLASFATVYGSFAGYFISFSILVFAFSTILAWSFYGEKTTNYVFGEIGVLFYKFLFPIVLVLGSVVSLRFVWELADILNGLIAIPNLLTILFLSGEVLQTTKKYERKRRSS